MVVLLALTICLGVVVGFTIAVYRDKDWWGLGILAAGFVAFMTLMALSNTGVI